MRTYQHYYCGSAANHVYTTFKYIMASLSRSLRLIYHTVFSALRVFALWSRNYYILCLVSTIGLIPIATNIVSPLLIASKQASEGI